MKTTQYLCFVIVALFLTGCSKTSTPETQEITTKNIAQVNTNQTGIEKCDKYLSTLRCMAQSDSGANAQTYIDRHNQLLAARKDLPVEQLNNICDALVKNVINNPNTLITTNCKI